MNDTTLTNSGGRPPATARIASRDVLALVIAWSDDEPGRIGEVVIPGHRSRVLGRTNTADAGEPAPLTLFRQRPGVNTDTGPLASRRVSRRQLRIAASDTAMVVENLGRRPIRFNGSDVSQAEIREGDVFETAGTLLLCVRRPERMRAPPPGVDLAHHDFGRADAFGFVGESPALWALRERIRFVGPRDEHLLVSGPSGAGKELVARALHNCSRRARQPIVARNAATIPESLIDAELFGNTAGYPNAGMAGRSGLIGEANGSTLFLDEIGEIPTSAQAHLLRVLDNGEYQRLGDARTLRSDLRLIAATNRDPTGLKHDLRARLALHIEVPGLLARPEDIPLIALHLLREIIGSDPVLRARFLRGTLPRVEPELIVGLVRHRYTAHVRELRSLLWQAITDSEGDTVAAVAPSGVPATGPAHTDRPDLPDEAQRVQAALDRHNGNQEAAWRELGLANRYVLRRLIRKYALEVRRQYG